MWLGTVSIGVASRASAYHELTLAIRQRHCPSSRPRCNKLYAVCDLLRRGLVPFFAHGIAPKYSTINARVETVETSPCYRGPWKCAQRCLMLSCAFFEWHLNEDVGNLDHSGSSGPQARCPRQTSC
jgi:hypothetical protein